MDGFFQRSFGKTMDIFAVKKHCERGWIQPAALAIRTFGSFLKFFERPLGKTIDKLKDGNDPGPLAVLNFLAELTGKTEDVRDAQRNFCVSMKDQIPGFFRKFLPGSPAVDGKLTVEVIHVPLVDPGEKDVPAFRKTS